jgi:hypothetical protein
MMKKILYILILTISLGLIANSQDYSNEDFRYVENNAFGLGEKLDYKVGYKFITAGTGSFYIKKKPIEVNGRKAYDVNFYVKSLSSLEWIYKVRDWYKTALDIGGIFPWRFEQHIREGKYKRDFEAEFDQKENIARTSEGDYEVPEYVHDIVSALYYVRTWNLDSMSKDSIAYLKNFYKDSTYSLGIKMLGKQTVEVEAGKFRCHVIEPLVQKGGLFKNEGNIVVWLTADERKIPVKVATKILIGYVGAELTNYSGVRGPIDAKLE